MPVIAIYVRVSTQRQAQSQSTEQQLERLRAYVLAQNWDLAPEYIFRDDGYSGGILQRPGLDRLRDAVASARETLAQALEPGFAGDLGLGLGRLKRRRCGREYGCGRGDRRGGRCG